MPWQNCVVAKQNLDERILKLTVGQQIALDGYGAYSCVISDFRRPITSMNRDSLPFVEVSSMSIPTVANIRSVSISSEMR